MLVEKSEIFKKIGTKCAITDFAILLGGYVSSYHTSDLSSKAKERTGWWYLSSACFKDIDIIYVNGDILSSDASKRDGGIRPVIQLPKDQNILSGTINNEGILEVEYGEYSQYVVDTSLAITLESNYLAGRIKKTGKTYTTDSRKWDDNSAPFRAQEHEEY